MLLVFMCADVAQSLERMVRSVKCFGDGSFMCVLSVRQSCRGGVGNVSGIGRVRARVGVALLLSMCC